MPIPRQRHPCRARRAALAAALAVLASLCAAGPAVATVSYVGPEELPAPSRSGNTLTSADGDWVCIPGCLPPTYEWQRCTSVCVTVPHRTGRTYPLSAADVGTRLRSLVTVADGFRTTSETRPSRQTATIAPLAGTTPPPTTTVRRLSPFPVVVIAGRLSRGRTVIRELTVRGPRGARVRVRCRGRGCPFRRTGGTIGRRKRLRLRAAQRSYPAGTRLEVRITARDRIGKFTRIRFRSRGTPTRQDGCLMPGATRPSRCP